MNRTPFVAGNWKMNKTISEARELTSALVPSLRDLHGVEKVICPPFTSLFPVASLLTGTTIGLGAQDIFWEPKGAFTGQISPSMIAEFCRYVIVGHSERRTSFGETDETVNKKVIASGGVGLTPIVCVGESLADYESGSTSDVVNRQILNGLRGLDDDLASIMVIAYEPVWAIGTGRASTGENANAVVKEIIRPALEKLFGNQIAQATRVLYGGSVTAANAVEFFSQTDIDGALVGGASLKVEEFTSIIKAAIE